MPLKASRMTCLLSVEDRVVGMNLQRNSGTAQNKKRNSKQSVPDHGAPPPMFVSGNPCRAGVLGITSTIPAVVNVNDNIPIAVRFQKCLLQHCWKNGSGLPKETVQGPVPAQCEQPVAGSAIDKRRCFV